MSQCLQDADTSIFGRVHKRSKSSPSSVKASLTSCRLPAGRSQAYQHAEETYSVLHGVRHVDVSRCTLRHWYQECLDWHFQAPILAVPSAPTSASHCPMSAGVAATRVPPRPEALREAAASRRMSAKQTTVLPRPISSASTPPRSCCGAAGGCHCITPAHVHYTVYTIQSYVAQNDPASLI